MKILHSYCLNNNLGDYALGIGLKNLLRDNLDVELISETNIQGREFNEYYIKEVVNKKYDLLVIGGGGIIHGAHWPNGWFWLIDIDLIKMIKIPFIIYGVGYNYWIEEGDIPDRGIKHLNETLKHAISFSVRNDGSAKRLMERTGIKASVIPDPGFHVDLNSKYKRPIINSYIIVQVANDKVEKRFKNKEIYRAFIFNMRLVINELSKKYKVILAPHTHDDISLSNEIIENIQNTEVWNFAYFAFDHSHEAIAYYKYADFVLSMRGHGQIIPICFNTPVISLENHPKHRGLMEELGLLEYSLMIDVNDFNEKLFSKIELLISQRKNLISQYKKINRKFRISSKLHFIDIKNRINEYKYLK